MLSDAYYFHIIRATTEQRGQEAAGLVGAAGGQVVSRMDVSIETLCSQCFAPAQGSNASLTGVCVAHICRGAGCWVTEILQISVAQLLKNTKKHIFKP